jgi:signal transduction histidine kinase
VLLHKASRRIALQSAGLLAVVVALAVAGLAAAFDRSQHAEIDRTVQAAARTADDVGDPPLGVVLVERHDGVVDVTPGAPAYLASFASAGQGQSSAVLHGHHYLRYAVTHDGRTYVAVYDLAAHHAEEQRLVRASAAAGVIGVVLAAGAGWLIGRRAVRPMARALTLQRRFVTDASHELRTPLTVLHTRAQLIRRRLANVVAPEQVRDLDQLIEDTSTLGEVVGDLLVSAQLQGQRIAGETVDLAALVAAVVRSLQPYAEESGVTLRDTTGSGAWTTTGARGALRRALGALVDNAISHAPGGHVDLTVSGDESWLRVAVDDDGEGLDPADAERLTTRFARGESAAEHQRRFGLGLALVDEVVRAHGGRLELAGAPGEGASVTMVLPRVRT